MRERPVPAPKFPLERVYVLQRCISNGGIADVGNDVVRFYGVEAGGEEVGDGGGRGGLNVVEGLYAAARVEGETPTVGVDVCGAAAFGEAW